MITEDRGYGYIYWRFNILGVATLLVWNIIIISSDFFRNEFQDTPFQDNFESLFSVLANIINLIAFCYALVTQPSATSYHHDTRIRNGLLATAGSLGTICLLALSGIRGWVALLVTLAALGVASVAAAYLQSSVLGIAARLPAYCVGGYMSGQAVAGTLTSAIQLALAIWTTSHKKIVSADSSWWWHLRLGTAVYFGVSAILMCLATMVWSQLNQRLMLDAQRQQPEEEEQQEQEVESTTLHAPMQEGSPRLIRNSVHDESRRRQEEEEETIELETTGSLSSWLVAPGGNRQLLVSTYKEITPFIWICVVVMAVTLSVFPPLTGSIVSSSSTTANLTAWHFLLFNLGDYLGRLSTQWLDCRSARVLHLINGLRLGFIPVFLMFPTRGTSTGLIHSDLLFLVLVLLLGWSNGWVVTMGLIVGPTGAFDKETAGSMLGFALGVGLVLGALTSYPVLLIAGIS